MVPCVRCGAPLGGTEEACGYCGTPTGRAKEAKDAVEAEVARLGKQALAWGLLCLVLGCCGVPNVIAVILGLRARRLALAHGLKVPAGSLVAFVIAGVTFAGVLGCLVLGIAEDHRNARRAAELEALFAKGAEEAVLSQPTACQMTEHALVTRGVDGKKPSYDAFRCDGALEQGGDGRAVLHEAEYHHYADTVVLEVTFKRGQRWRVQDVRAAADAPRSMPSAASTMSGAKTGAPQ